MVAMARFVGAALTAALVAASISAADAPPP
eukprot:COSAG06_NODE_25985_length_624_cov_1.493333_2_plen_29_part_01